MGSSGHNWSTCARLRAIGFTHIGSSHFHHRAFALAVPSAWNNLSPHLYTASFCPLSLRSQTFVSPPGEVFPDHTFIHSFIHSKLSECFLNAGPSLGDKIYLCLNIMSNKKIFKILRKAQHNIKDTNISLCRLAISCFVYPLSYGSANTL